MDPHVDSARRNNGAERVPERPATVAAEHGGCHHRRRGMAGRETGGLRLPKLVGAGVCPGPVETV